LDDTSLFGESIIAVTGITVQSLRNTLAVCAWVLLFPSVAHATPPESVTTAPTIAVAPDEASLRVILPPAPARTERANPGLFKAGVALVMLGAAGLAVGVALGSAGEGCSESDQGLCVAGGVVGAIAGALFVTGIPLAAIGGKRVPAHPAPEGLDWTPTLVTAPGGCGLRWAF
jgi:hypothetical protein